MNVYVLVEGVSEKYVYNQWIQVINPALKPIDRLELLASNNYFIMSAMGYPYYFEMIDRAIDDINIHNGFNRLVIMVDSEDMTRDEKYSEIIGHINGQHCSAEIIIVIQHFCFEAWALGNRRLVRSNPTSDTLRNYKYIFNVRVQDPELLPQHPNNEWNRAQFSRRYLTAALNERHRNLSYSKSKPVHIAHPKYFEQLRIRKKETGHIQSFDSFLNAFI